MFDNIVNFFKKLKKTERFIDSKSKEAAKERLHLVLMQDRANVSADFLEMMKQEIIEVIKKYIDIDEKEIDVKLTNKMNDDGTIGAPALYANIPIVTIKNEARKISKEDEEKEETVDETIEEINTKNDEKDKQEEKEAITIEDSNNEKNNNIKDNANNKKKNERLNDSNSKTEEDTNIKKINDDTANK